MITMSSKKRMSTIAVLLIFSVLTGCGDKNRPPLGTVTGLVTLDGQPLKNASVVFQPTTGRPSSGVTDESGRYSLVYGINANGALIGNHQVIIRTTGMLDDDSIKEKEILPSKYNNSSELKVEVVAGRNQHDFPLLSK